MDCNKDEASKAKLLAEKKLEEKDISGARKIALKAQSLFPELDGLQHLLTTLNIYVAVERKINGEIDWYGVLGVDPSSDDETVKKQYRKLALILHPDKNKSVGAEGAFKILSEAWSLLSDKSKRSLYDQRRTSSRNVYQKVVPTHPSKSTARDNHASGTNRYYNGVVNTPNPHLVPPQRRNTFWTVCTSCKMQFEYVMLYLNKKLECYSCKKPFQAIPIAPPQTNTHPPSWAANLSQNTPSCIPGKTHVSNGHIVYPGAVENVPAMNGAELPRNNLKRHDNAQVEKPRKRRRASGAEKAGGFSMGSEAFGFKTFNGSQISSIGMERMATGGTRELTVVEIQNLLVEKAKKEISLKLNEWKNLATKANHSKTGSGPQRKDKSKDSDAGLNRLSNAYANEVQIVGHKPAVNAYFAKEFETSPVSSGVSEAKSSENGDLSMIVPDSDFHDFDKFRTENSFGDNEVWAAYDNDDGMPRYYAMVHNVISRKPFKMRISWLNSKSTAEFGNTKWVEYGFYKTSGDFRVGKHELNKMVNAFSHRVKWRKGARGAIRIFPSKGDTWAMYKNWSSEWNEHTPDEVIHQYDMVEVLTDYDEEKGVTIIPLVKVSGFKTVFRQHMDQEKVQVIPREEMFRFSHQVPSCLLTGRESYGSPKGCLELDPAATPMELLQVTTDARVPTKKEDNEIDTGGVGSSSEKIQSKSADIARDEAKLMNDGVRVQVGTVTVG